MSQKRSTAPTWRKYLQGEYLISKKESRQKMHHDIRKRALRLMEDLLLISQSSVLQLEEKRAIFNNLEAWKKMPVSMREQRLRQNRSLTVWENVTMPLAKELVNQTAYNSPINENHEDILSITQRCEVLGIKYSRFLLLNDEEYRKKKIRSLERNEEAEKLANIIRTKKTQMYKFRRRNGILY